ncbi:MAG: DUF1273 domain-containing protein [Clostridia bacterium]|nr:DUF1273 domain-containing protein [Clostridia bacterium]
MYYTCAFTGHRNLRNTDFDSSLLDRVILNLIKGGTKVFLCGMALGFDLEAAQSVIMYKKDYDVKLVACIPCAGQEAKFSGSAKNLYGRILENCDEVRVLSDEYYKGCMHSRDRYMVDNCDVLVSFLRRNSGGTYYTVNYAQKTGKKIIAT